VVGEHRQQVLRTEDAGVEVAVAGLDDVRDQIAHDGGTVALSVFKIKASLTDEAVDPFSPLVAAEVGIHRVPVALLRYETGDVLKPGPNSGQIAWASSANAAATRRAGGTSRPSCVKPSRALGAADFP
jgi:hypothetical protein